jgi:hypothetical protein
MSKRVRLWVRTDGEEPKAVERDATKAPGPGKLVDVQALNAADARARLALAGTKEPDEHDDPQGWLAWRAARRSVFPVEVTS